MAAHSPVTPSIHSFLIADMVFQMEMGKWGIVGVFQKLISMKFPAVWHSLGLFVVLTDAEGTYEVRVEFQDTNGRQLALVEGIGMRVGNRLDRVGFGITTHGLLVPAPGVYFVKLFFNGVEAVGEIRLEAELVQGESG